jgi:5-methylcytosine-specific restriction protein B
MTVSELGAELKSMYHSAAEGDTVAMIHLFGVKFAEQIRECGGSPKDIAIAAGISHNYGVEVNKGVNLARFVQVRTSAQPDLGR